MLKISAKTGLNVHDVMEAIHTRIPAPVGDAQQPLKALVFDSQYDAFKGIIAYVRLVDGALNANDKLTLMANGQAVTANEIGIFAPQRVATKKLQSGDVGYVVTGLKDPQALRVGDTLTTIANPTATALPGYEPSQSMVFAGFYPQGDHYHDLQLAVEKLALNDTSFHYRPESSDALGAGFRCGFLGIFHLQIIRERLHDEYGLDVLTTAPNVTYRVHLKNTADPVVVNNPIKFPDYSQIDFVEEPLATATITTTSDSLSDVMKLATQHRGELQDMRNQGDLVVLVYQLPFAEIAYDFFNALKSVSHGYATLTTALAGYDIADVVKIEVHVNYAKVDALSFVVHREDAPKVTQELVQKLKFVIPRKLYPMPVQGVVEGKALSRVDVPPLRLTGKSVARLRSKPCYDVKV